MRALISVVVGAVGCLSSCSNKLADGSTDGATIFAQACARCHGSDGIPSPSLAHRTGVKPLNSETVIAMTDSDLRKQILKGSKNRRMPSFESAITDVQLDALVIHLRSLATKATNVTGDQ